MFEDSKFKFSSCKRWTHLVKLYMYTIAFLHLYNVHGPDTTTLDYCGDPNIALRPRQRYNPVLLRPLWQDVTDINAPLINRVAEK